VKQAWKSHERELARLMMTVDTLKRGAGGERRMLAAMEPGKGPGDVTGEEAEEGTDEADGDATKKKFTLLLG
jgi:hypothetical protein